MMKREVKYIVLCERDPSREWEYRERYLTPRHRRNFVEVVNECIEEQGGMKEMIKKIYSFDENELVFDWKPYDKKYWCLNFLIWPDSPYIDKKYLFKNKEVKRYRKGAVVYIKGVWSK